MSPDAILNRNLIDIPFDLPFPPVVEVGRARIGVPGQVLHVLPGHVLLQQVGDRRHAEGVGPVEEGQEQVQKFICYKGLWTTARKDLRKAVA